MGTTLSSGEYEKLCVHVCFRVCLVVCFDDVILCHSESCVELFLAYLLVLLKADHYNLQLLAGKVSVQCST